MIERTAENGKLWADLRRLDPAPDDSWPAFGVHVVEGWREDGFCVAFLLPSQVAGPQPYASGNVALDVATSNQAPGLSIADSRVLCRGMGLGLGH